MAKNFPFYKQHDATDCGATCLRMVARYYGRFYSLEYLRSISHQRREGVSLLEISDAAEQIGFRTLAAKITFAQLKQDVPLPCIIFWRQNHYMVVYKVGRNYVDVADPAVGLLRMKTEEFKDGFLQTAEDGEELGIALLLETTPEFSNKEEVSSQNYGLGYILQYLGTYRNLIVQLGLGLALSVVLQLIFPFLIKALVDEGVESLNFNFVLLVLGAWLVLYLSQKFVEHLRNWILLHVGIRTNVNLISDFLIKVARLPIRYFDQKMTSDLLKRIYDNERVERLLTSNVLPSFFSVVGILLMGFVLWYFDLTVFLIFLFGTVVYFVWVLRFMAARREMDYIRFDRSSENQSKLIELINGMQEIQLNNAETQKRWEWERSEASLFRASMGYLSIDQRQRLGANIINELKNILITVFAAKAVIDGQMTIGVLFAIQYIIGQMNEPVHQLVEFIRAFQDARISIERLNEVHLREQEDESKKINILPQDQSLRLENVSFRYGGSSMPLVLRNITAVIPQGKTTAIVGSSGSGKTTLLKLLLNIYQPTEGSIKLGEIKLSNIQSQLWRSKAGAVLQNGYIFSDTIARNIAMGEDIIDERQLLQATKMANIQAFIESMPLGYNTKIGAEGVGLSQGQRQRILIARALYKQPEFLFMDEATSALDAYNEMIILENIEEFFAHKTQVVVAHRLSTVMNADYILVLEAGELIEQGTHQDLTKQRGIYYHLLRNQLELGN